MKIIKEQWNKLSDEQKINFWSIFLKEGEQIDITSVDELAVPDINDIFYYIKTK